MEIVRETARLWSISMSSDLVSSVTYTKLAPPTGLEQITFVQSFYRLFSFRVGCANRTQKAITDLTFWNSQLPA